MENNKKLHVVMFPWLAFGHMIPFLELSEFIAKKGHRVSFISTPKNVDRLPKPPSNLSSSITFVKIPLPKVEQLPENAEATSDIPIEYMDNLKKAYDGMEPDLARFLEKSNADAIIYDFAPHWLPPVAATLGISGFFFCIFPSWFLAFLGSTEALVNGLEERKKPEDFLSPPRWVTFDTKVAYRLYEAKWVVGAAKENTSGFSDTFRAGKVISASDAMIIKHCNVFESEKWIKLLGELHKKPVFPLGLMPPRLRKDTVEDNDETWISIQKWLDGQKKGSVVYVALGSELNLSEAQLVELAFGLELSGLPSFWALRKPTEAILNQGFEERIKGRAVVWRGWAPQLKILSHDSIGSFLTHAGISSPIEALTFARPLIMLPMLIDQGLNARVLADKQVGIEVPRNEEDGSYTRHSVAQAIRFVMDEDKGEVFRDRAKDASKIFQDRELQFSYLENIVEHITNYIPKPQNI